MGDSSRKIRMGLIMKNIPLLIIEILGRMIISIAVAFFLFNYLSVFQSFLTMIFLSLWCEIPFLYELERNITKRIKS